MSSMSPRCTRSSTSATTNSKPSSPSTTSSPSSSCKWSSARVAWALPALCVTRESLFFPILPNFPIHRDRHVFPCLQIPKLHHPMPFTGEFSPSARLLRILLDGLVLPPTHRKPDRPKTPTPRPCYPQNFALHHHLWPTHQPLGNQSH